MKYLIELDKYDLARLKHLVKDALQRELKSGKVFTLQENYTSAELADYEATQLTILLGKLANIIPVADKITEDTSILAKRKYSLFGRK